MNARPRCDSRKGLPLNVPETHSFNKNIGFVLKLGITNRLQGAIVLCHKLRPEATQIV
jgi:hypothetical protein